MRPISTRTQLLQPAMIRPNLSAEPASGLHLCLQIQHWIVAIFGELTPLVRSTALRRSSH